MDMSGSPAIERKEDFIAACRMRGMNEIWKPNVTVAAVVERAGRFLLIEEETEGGPRYNQPAGHLDEGESLAAACSREALEETAWHFRPTALVGIYQWPRPRKENEGDITYLRFAFAGELGNEEVGRPLDTGILRTVWMTADEVEASKVRHRSPLVWQCVQDYLAGRRYPLELIKHYE
jgi:ADP-ribose pyrophosphatase YjhB (NUDIX family)